MLNCSFKKAAYLLGLDQHQVVAGLWAGMAAPGQCQQARLSAGGAGPGVAPVGLSGRVVAGWRTPEGDNRVAVNESYRCEGIRQVVILCVCVYLQVSLQRGGLVLRSLPQGTAKTVEPHVHLTSTDSGQG